MAAIAKRLVLRGAATAQRRAQHEFAIDVHLGIEGERSVLAHPDQIDHRCRLVRSTILAAVGDRAGRAGMGDADDRLDRAGLGMDPLTRRIGNENLGMAEHTIARMDAQFAVETDVDVLAFDEFPHHWVAPRLACEKPNARRMAAASADCGRRPDLDRKSVV